MFVSYLNSPRKGCPGGMNICVWTHLGLIKSKTTSKKLKMEDDLKKKDGRRTPPPKKKWKQPFKKNGRRKNDLKKKSVLDSAGLEKY
jgi:hypothetical protein